MDEEEEEQAWERDRLGLQEGECSYGWVSLLGLLSMGDH